MGHTLISDVQYFLGGVIFKMVQNIVIEIAKIVTGTNLRVNMVLCNLLFYNEDHPC